MARVVEPKVFFMAETKINWDGLRAFLRHLGVPDWTTDAWSDSEFLIETAGKSCYMSFSTDLNKNLTRVGTRNNEQYIQEQIIGVKHGSVLEHTSCSFALADVSRVFTHELVRHRVGVAFSQVSGRYVRSDNIGYPLPSVISENPAASSLFEGAFVQMEKWVRELEKIYDIDNPEAYKGKEGFQLKKILTSAFRRVIGNGQSNHIIFTANHRSLRHEIEVRTSEGAEEEIRIVFNDIFRIVHGRYPAIYKDAVVAQKRGHNEVTFAASKI
jgi:thymidylate synthase (FAD)